MKEKILEILKEIKPYAAITEKTELIEEGVLDSLSVILLISNLEEMYELEIPEEEINPHTLKNIQSIALLIENSRKK